MTQSLLTRRNLMALGITAPPAAIFGCLLPNGVSGAQYGFRANAADGTPIFDSSGLISVLTLVGSGGSADNALTISTTDPSTFTAITGDTTTLTVTRQANFLITARCNALVTSTGAGFYAYSELFIDGTKQNGLLDAVFLWDKRNTGNTGEAGTWIKTLAAGSHTIDLRISTSSTTETWHQYESQFLVFRIGA